MSELSWVDSSWVRQVGLSVTIGVKESERKSWVL